MTTQTSMASDLHPPQAGGVAERTAVQEGMFTPSDRVMKLHVEPLLSSAETQAELGTSPQILSPVSGRLLQTTAVHSPGVFHRAGFVPAVPASMMMGDAFSPSAMTPGGHGRGVKICLESKNEHREEAAAISIELDNNEEMITKVLDILSAKFPLDAFYRAMQNRAGMIQEVCAEERGSQYPLIYTDGVSQGEQEDLRGKWRQIIAEADPLLLRALTEAGQQSRLTKSPVEKRSAHGENGQNQAESCPTSPLAGSMHKVPASHRAHDRHRSRSAHSASNSSHGSHVSSSHRVEISHHSASQLSSHHSSHHSSRHVIHSKATASVILAPPLVAPQKASADPVVPAEKPVEDHETAAGKVVSKKGGSVRAEPRAMEDGEFQEEGKWQELAEEEWKAEIETQHSKTITSDSVSSMMQSNHTEENRAEISKTEEGFLVKKAEITVDTKIEKTDQKPKGEIKAPTIVGRGSTDLDRGSEKGQKPPGHLQGKVSAISRAMSGSASEVSITSSAKSSHWSTIYQKKRYSTVHPFIARGFGKFPAVFAQFALSVAPAVLGEILKMNRDNGHRVAAMAESLRCNPVMIIGLMDYMDKTGEFKKWCEMLLHLDADLSPIETQQGASQKAGNDVSAQATFSIYKGVGSVSGESERSASSRRTTELLSPHELAGDGSVVGIELQKLRTGDDAKPETTAKAAGALPLASASATKYRTELELALEAEDHLIRSKVDAGMKGLFKRFQVPNSEVQMDLGSVETQANNIDVLMNRRRDKYEHRIEKTRREVYEGIRDMLNGLGFRSNIEIKGEAQPSLGEEEGEIEQHEDFSSDYVSRLDRTVQEATVRLAIVSLAENLSVSSLSESGQFSDLLIDVLNTPRLGGVARRQHEDIAKIINTHRTRSLKTALNAAIDSVAWKPIIYETLLRNVESVICKGPSFIETPDQQRPEPAKPAPQNIVTPDQQHQAGQKGYYQANIHQGVGSHSSSGPYHRPQMSTTPSSPTRSLASAPPMPFPHGQPGTLMPAQASYSGNGGGTGRSLPSAPPLAIHVGPMKQTPFNIPGISNDFQPPPARPAMHTHAGVAGVQGTIYCHQRGAGGPNMAVCRTSMMPSAGVNQTGSFGGGFANSATWQNTSPTNSQVESSRMERSSQGTDQVQRNMAPAAVNSQLTNVGSTLTDMGAKLTSMGQSVHMMEAALTPPHSRSPTHYLVARTDLVSARPYSVAEGAGDMSPRMQTSPRHNANRTGPAPPPPQVIYAATATSDKSGMRVVSNVSPSIIAPPMPSVAHKVDQVTTQAKGPDAAMGFSAPHTTTTISTAADSRFTSTPTKLASTQSQSHEESYIGHSAASAYSTIPIRAPARPVTTTTTAGSLPHSPGIYSGNVISNPRASPLAKMQNNNILGQIISHYRDSEPRRDF